MANSLILSIIIRAYDQASGVMAKLGLAGSGAFGLLTAGAVTVGAALAAAGVASVVMANQFDYNMQKIKALTSVTGDQFNTLKQQVLAMAPSLDQSPTALAQGLYFVLSAGVPASQAMNVLALSAKAAASTMTPMASVADLLTTAMNAYRGSNVSAGHAMDDLIETVVQGKVTMSSLATSMGFVLVTAKAAGLSIDQASAAVATLSQVGGEHGARRIMMDLDNSMRMVGIETEKVSAKAEKMKGLKAPWNAAAFAAMNYMQKLQYIAQETGGVGYLDKTQAAAYEATGNMSNLAQATAHANANFMSLVGGAAAFIPSAMLLSDKGAEYSKVLASMGGNGEKTAHAFDIMRQSTGQQLKMFETSLETIATVIGEQLLPAVSAIVSGLYHVGQSTIAFLQSAGGMQAFKYAILGIALVVTAILMPSIIGVVIAAAPLLLTIAGIVAGGILLGMVIRAVVAHFGGWSAVLRALHPLLSTIQGAFAAAGRELRAAFANPAVQQAFAQLQAALPGLIPLLQILGVIIGVTLVVGFHLFVALLAGAAGAIPGFLMLVSGLINVLGGLGRFLKDVFTANWRDLLPALKQIGQGLLQIVGGVLLEFLGFAHGFADHFLTLFGSSDAKVKAAFTRIGHAILTTVGGWFSGLGAAIHNGIVGIGAKFSALGTLAHRALMAAGRLILDAILWPWRQIGALAHWLYQHNTYVQRAVDGWRRILTAVHAFISAKMEQIRAAIGQAWSRVVAGARTAFGLFYRYVAEPVQRVWQAVTTTLGKLAGWLAQQWDAIKKAAQLAWQTFVRGLQTQVTAVWNAAKSALVDPITKAWSQITTTLAHAGSALMQMIGKDIEHGAHYIEDAAKKALGKLAGWLGFHSPAPNVPESANWGSNLIGMFATSMLSGLPAATRAARAVMQQVGGALAGRTGGAGALSAGGVGAGAGSAIASGIASGLRGLALAGSGAGAPTAQTVNHTWNLNFPNATNSQQIQDAVKQVQQQTEQRNYRLGRRAGSYGGLRAGIDTLT